MNTILNTPTIKMLSDKLTEVEQKEERLTPSHVQAFCLLQWLDSAYPRALYQSQQEFFNAEMQCTESRLEQLAEQKQEILDLLKLQLGA